MATTDPPSRPWLAAFSAALPLMIMFVVALSIPLAAAQGFGLSAQETSLWIMMLWGLPGLLTLILTGFYRQPLLITGNIFAMIFVFSLPEQLRFPELVGAFLVAGAAVLVVGLLGLTRRLATWIPPQVVLGLLAGALIPFVSDVFNWMGQAPLIVGSTFIAYIAGSRLLSSRIPPILPALIVGLAAAALTGRLAKVSMDFAFPAWTMIRPEFTFESILTTAPVLFVLILVQANLPSVIFMQSQGYEPPARALNISSGIGIILGSLLGPVAVSLSLPATSLVASPPAGKLGERYRAALLAGGTLLVIGLLAGAAAELTAAIPLSLLLALAGLAMVGVLAGALKEITQGKVTLGPLFAFAVALSEISLLGLGPFFWALVIGTVTSLLLEREGLPGAAATPEDGGG